MKLRTLILILTSLAALSFAANAGDKEKKEQVCEKGCVAIFDGKTLDGWKHDPLGQATYEVKDGIIVGTTVEGSPNSFLLSKKQYGDFELRFETKVDTGLNSGVQIRSRPKNKADIEAEAKAKGKKPNKHAAVGRVFGPQVEIESSPGQSGYIYGEATGLGWLSPEPGDKGHAHSHIKNDDWNDYRILAEGPRIQTWINGEKVADLNHDEIYETHPKGHIGLQVHGIKAGTGPFQARWRNIRIREIK